MSYDTARPSLESLEQVSVKKQKTLSFLKGLNLSLSLTTLAAPTLSLVNLLTGSNMSSTAIWGTLALGAAAQFAAGALTKVTALKQRAQNKETFTRQIQAAAEDATTLAGRLGDEKLASLSLKDVATMGRLVHLPDTETQKLPLHAQHEIYRAQTLLCLDAIRPHPKTEITHLLAQKPTSSVTQTDIDKQLLQRDTLAANPNTLTFTATHPDLNKASQKNEALKDQELQDHFSKSTFVESIQSGVTSGLFTALSAITLPATSPLGFAALINLSVASSRLMETYDVVTPRVKSPEISGHSARLHQLQKNKKNAL